VVKEDKRTQEKVVVTKTRGPKQNLGIPYGHLPAPGQCRIWVPGRPSGHQPRAGNCHSVMKKIIPGCWLLTRSESNPKLVQVTVFDRYDAGEVVMIRYYIAKTGAFDHEDKL
jgi:hypothetical protein